MAYNQPAASTSRPRGDHIKRSWTENGVHHTSTSYSRPGMVFNMHSASTGTRFSRQRSESSGGGIIGAAFNLLGDVMTASSQRGGRRGGRSVEERRPEVDHMAYGEYEQEEEEEVDVRPKPRGLFGNLAEKILIGQQERTRQEPRRRERSPVKRNGRGMRRGGRQRSHTEDVRGSAASARSYHDDMSDSDSISDSETDDTSADEAYDAPPRRATRRAFTINDVATIRALENAVEHHRREMVLCRRRFDAASRQPMMSTAVLQGILNELKKHEQAHENAKENLRIAQVGMGNGQRQAPQQSRSTRPGQARRATMEQPFASVFASDPAFQSFFGMGSTNGGFYTSSADPLTPGFGTFPFAAFDPIFQSFGDPFARTYSYSTPRASFTFNGQSHARPGMSTHTGPQFGQPGFTPVNTAPASPPATLLKPEEAKRLFTTYNQRWNSLAPTDSNIPYPARGHRASALAARDSIWAPTCDAHVSTWSEETVMQANAQAFFLGVVGLSPRYTEAPATGKIGMGYNKARATPAQTKELVDILKKEKIRWHSDRLGRRNGGGSAGPNEALQTDQRARAVFHAVCELMEVAQGA